MNRTTDPYSSDPSPPNMAADSGPHLYPQLDAIQPTASQARAQWRRDSTYWTESLRLRTFLSLMPALVDNEDARGSHVRTWLNNGLRTRVACELLDLSPEGTIAQRQERLIAEPDVVYLLLACGFAVRKKDRALDHASDLLLTADDRARWGQNDRIDDRNVLAMLLFDREPGCLQTVRVLDEWHSLSVGSALLNEQPSKPDETLEGFLYSARFHQLLADESVKFDQLIPMSGGDYLVALRRNRRPAYYISAADQLEPGWEEEPVILHFREGAEP